MALLATACGRIGFGPFELPDAAPAVDGHADETGRDASEDACTPASETCNGEDDDCDGLVDNGAETLLCPVADEVCWAGRCGTPPHAEWAVRWGGGGRDEATTVAFCPDGDLVVGGSFHGAVSFGTQDFVSQGQRDALVLRLRADGTLRWLWNRGGEKDDGVSAVACDADGRVVAAGSFEGAIRVGDPTTVDLGGGLRTLATGNNAFVVALDSAGAWRWDHVMGAVATGNATTSSLAVTADGDVLVAGSFDGSVDLGRGTRTAAGGLDAFLVRLDGDGGRRADRVWSSTLDDEAISLAAAHDGSVILAGGSNGPIRLGTDGTDAHVNSDENPDAFVARLDAEGALLAERWWTGTGWHFVRGVAVTDGAVAACGQVSGDTRIDGADGELPVALEGSDALLVRYDPLLVDASWRLWSSGGDTFCTAIAGTRGGMVAVGRFQQTVDFGGGARTSEGMSDGFSVWLGSDGRYVGDAPFHGEGNEQDALGVAVANDGRTAIVGGFRRQVTIGTETLTLSDGSRDGFVALLAP